MFQVRSTVETALYVCFDLSDPSSWGFAIKQVRNHVACDWLPKPYVPRVGCGKTSLLFTPAQTLFTREQGTAIRSMRSRYHSVNECLS